MNLKLLSVSCILLFSSLAFTSCKQSGASEATKPAGIRIVKLLDRKAVLGSSEEKEYMVSSYEKLAAALSANPSDYESAIKLSEIYIVEARTTGEHGYYYNGAINLLNDVLAAKPNNSDIRFRALSNLASVQLSLHKFQDALKTAEQAVQINSYNSGIYGALVDANVELGNYKKAVEMADKMVSIRPDLRSYSRVSYLREIHGDIPGAIEAMKLAVSAGLPGNEQTAWSRVTLGGLYESTGNLVDAEAQYKMALYERENYPFAIAGLAGLEIKKKNYANAEQLLQKAIGLIPEVHFYVMLSELYELQGEKEKTKRLNDEIMNMIKDDEKQGHEMGLELSSIALKLLNDPKRALKAAQQEFKRRPENIDVNKMMANIYFMQGDIAKADQHLQKAMVTNSKSAELIGLNGMIQFKKGDATAGSKLINQSLSIDPYQHFTFSDELRKISKSQARI